MCFGRGERPVLRLSFISCKHRLCHPHATPCCLRLLCSGPWSDNQHRGTVQTGLVRNMGKIGIFHFLTNLTRSNYNLQSFWQRTTFFSLRMRWAVLYRRRIPSIETDHGHSTASSISSADVEIAFDHPKPEWNMMEYAEIIKHLLIVSQDGIEK